MSYDNYPSYSTQDPSNLQFYSTPSSSAHGAPSQFYHAGPDPQQQRNTNLGGAIGRNNAYTDVAGAIAGQGGDGVVRGWLNAFGTGGIEGEMPLLQELGINFDHILQKSWTVLNPLATVDAHMMDDADLAGPLVFCLIFAMLLLLSGKPQFSYIYGTALLGSASIYALLNLMSESGIDAYRTTSVLGYCLLPLVLLSVASVVVSLDGSLGYLLSALTIIWCSYSASSIFATVLRLSSQRFLVAYPVGLLYAAFALLSVFDGKTGGLGGR